MHSTEPDVPLYVPSGALGSAAPPLGISDAFAALTGSPAVLGSFAPARAPPAPPHEQQPLEAVRRPSPALSDATAGIVKRANAEALRQKPTGAESQNIFGDVSVIASAPRQPSLAAHDSGAAEARASAQPSQAADAQSSDLAEGGHRESDMSRSAESSRLNAAAVVSLDDSQQAHAEHDPAVSTADVLAAVREDAATPADTADLSGSEQIAVLQDQGTELPPATAGQQDLQVHTDDDAASTQVQDARASSPVPLYSLLPVFGLGGTATGNESPVPGLGPKAVAAASDEASIPLAEFPLPTSEQPQAHSQARQAEVLQPLYTVLPALGSWPAAPLSSSSAEPLQAQTAASLPDLEQHGGDDAEEPRVALGMEETLGEARRLVLPGSKAGQKRARQAAAAAARQQQHQQLPAKRSWEEWLQPGVHLSRFFLSV